MTRRAPAIRVWKSRYTGHWCRQIRGSVGCLFFPSWREAMGLDVAVAEVAEPCS